MAHYDDKLKYYVCDGQDDVHNLLTRMLWLMYRMTILKRYCDENLAYLVDKYYHDDLPLSADYKYLELSWYDDE